MGDPKGFLMKGRADQAYRPVSERVRDFADVALPREETVSKEQASRCMDCGTPFCHWGCPVGNHIPEWNDLVYRSRWEEAYKLLSSTNPLPEITGRVCPAPCERACVLDIGDGPVTIRENELAVMEKAFDMGLLKPRRQGRSFKEKIAVIGSGPAGLSCAAYLARSGYAVTVLERDEKPGGLLRFGIPDFKLEKWILDRRLAVMEAEGVSFRCSVDVGTDVTLPELEEEYDSICIAAGCRVPRDLDVEGRHLEGIHFAMDYLSQANRRLAGEALPAAERIDAAGRKVVIIGGGDTGSDCAGTANRQQAKRVVQIELLPRPADERTEGEPWPCYPATLRNSSSCEEGLIREWSLRTEMFAGERGRVKKLLCRRLGDVPLGAGSLLSPSPEGGGLLELEADLVLIAAGFVRPEKEPLLSGCALDLDDQGRLKVDAEYRTSRRGIYAAGDVRRGQSLVIWAVYEGLRAGRAIHRDLRA